MNITAPSKSWIWRQRIGYGSADFACNLIWQMISLYLLYFYTDVMKLPAVAISIMFLAVRVIDGAADLMVGILIDKTKTRWGKARPYILFGSVPYAICTVLTFSVPQVGQAGMIAYAAVTYFLLSLMYSIVNVPLSSILPSLTKNLEERTNLATSRIFFSFLGSTVVSYFGYKWIHALGKGDLISGFQYVSVIFALISLVVFVFTFMNTREIETSTVESFSALKAIKSLKHNKPWKIFIVMHFFMWGGYFLQTGAHIYYFTYNINDIALATTVATITSLIPIAGNFVVPLLNSRFTKRDVFWIGAGIQIIGMAFIWMAGTNVDLILTGAVINAVGYGIKQTIYFSMQADPVDYGEYVSGINTAGTLSAVNAFAGKVWMAIAGSVSAAILGMTGYVGGQAVQLPETLLAIKAMYIIVPTIFLVCSIIVMKFYDLDKKLPGIVKELNDRKSMIAQEA